MNYNYEYEEEVDLRKLIYFCMSKWKSIVACAFAGAILGGALVLLIPNIFWGNSDEEDITKYTKDTIEYKVLELQETNAEIASQAVMNAMDLIEESRLINVDPYNMYVGSFSMLSFAPLEDLIVIESALQSFNANRVLYDELSKNEDFYSKNDLQKLISLSVSNQTEEDINYAIGTIVAYGATEAEVEFMLKEANTVLNDYLKSFSEYEKDLTYYNINSDITLTEYEAIADYQQELYENLVDTIESEKETISGIEYKSDLKVLIIYIVIGAFLTGVASASTWFVIFFVCGKLYSVSDIEKKFKTNLLGTVAVCDKKNPIDKWLFYKINGLYSQFSKDEQEKIVLLNIKNELKKSEDIKKVILISSISDTVKESAQFIKAGLEAAGYTVSNCANVIGRPDVMENAAEYDAAIVVESMSRSSINLVAEEIDVIKEYMSNGSYMVLV